MRHLESDHVLIKQNPNLENPLGSTEDLDHLLLDNLIQEEVAVLSALGVLKSRVLKSRVLLTLPPLQVGERKCLPH